MIGVNMNLHLYTKDAVIGANTNLNLHVKCGLIGPNTPPPAI